MLEVIFMIATNDKNGGLISLEELRERLIRARGKRKEHQEISKDDLLRASQKLKSFGSGFNVIPYNKGKVSFNYFNKKAISIYILRFSI